MFMFYLISTDDTGALRLLESPGVGVVYLGLVGVAD